MTGPQKSPAYQNYQSEYWFNVSSQKDLPIAGTIESALGLDDRHSFLTQLSGCRRADEASAAVQEAVLDDPELFHLLRQVIGLSDKRAYLELSFRASRTPNPDSSSGEGLCGCFPWNMGRHQLTFFINMLSNDRAPSLRNAAARLLAEILLDNGLLEAAQGFTGMPLTWLATVFSTLVASKEVQQRAAKRRGHGCEAALASVIIEAGASLIPREKAMNPMGSKDPHLDRDTLTVTTKQRDQTYAFDMLILQGNDVRVAVQALIHTSDPGQYGVNKSDETVAIARHLKRTNTKLGRTTNPVELWGLLDGIGFSENKEDTLNKMLGSFDYFVQLKTLYKAPLRLHAMGLCSVRAIEFTDFYNTQLVKDIADL